MVVDVQMSRAGDVVKAQVVLNQLKATGAGDPKRALSFADVRTLSIRLRAPGSPPATVTLPRAAAAARAAAPPPGRRPGGGNKENFDLSSFYTNDGALGDSDNNLIPDRVDVELSTEGDGSEGAADLAARLGLESTGVAVPIARPARSIATPESEPILVLVGVEHPLIDRLIRSEKWKRPALQPGEGLIQVVRKAFGEKSALIVTGGDRMGVDRALRQLAERFPHIWTRGKDRTTLDEVEDDLRKFIAGRSPAGQAAMSLYKLQQLAKRLEGKDLTAARVRVLVEKAADGLAPLLEQEARARIKAASITAEVQNLDVQKGRPLVNEELDVPSEVDDFWTKLRPRVLPAIRKQQPVTVEARLSEPTELRERIGREARAELVRAGADDRATTVTVLSAYKQGYSWV